MKFGKRNKNPKTKIELKKVNPEDLSNIRVQYFIGNSRITDYYEILTIKYSGKYGMGSAGNDDAIYMCAKGESGLSCYEPMGVILDLSDVEYEWGDMMDMVLGIGSDMYIDSEFPVALMVGEKCSEAIGTLIHGIDSNEPATTEEWIFEDFDLAWKYLEGKIEKQTS